MVSTSGTYQAITYDILHEEGRADQYSKIAGRAYALYLAGAGVANVASGFIAAHASYRHTFFIAVASCLLNVVIILMIKEPTFHKAEAKARVAGIAVVVLLYWLWSSRKAPATDTPEGAPVEVGA